jgi:simple sugar transport system ATP-binding protein
MLCGLYQPDSGYIARNGQRVALSSPRAGLQHGIAMVHQHFRLVDRFTVAENVILGSRNLSFVLDRRSINERVSEVAESYGLPIDPTATVGDLSVGQRQRVEIVKALYQGAEILLLDEPTAVLVPAEVEKLFENVHAMTQAGKSIVFISHKLGEVVEISDRVTVLRGGKVTGHVSGRGATDTKDLARLMVGRDINLGTQRASHPTGHEVLQIRDLSLRWWASLALQETARKNSPTPLPDFSRQPLVLFPLVVQQQPTADPFMHANSALPMFLRIDWVWALCRP